MVFVFFSESQFDSYRMLGVHTMEILCTACGGDFRGFVREILKTHLEMEVPRLAGEIARRAGKGKQRLKFAGSDSGGARPEPNRRGEGAPRSLP
jgi:hypothetical protein